MEPLSEERQAAPHLLPAAPREPLHHLLGLLEVLEQAVDVLDRRAAPLRDPLAAAAVDHAGVAPLLPGHRVDDRHDAFQLLELASQSGDHPQDVLEGSHFPEPDELIAEVVERELAPADLSRKLL